MKPRLLICCVLATALSSLAAETTEQALMRMKVLLDKRLITQEDYDKQKAELLKRELQPADPTVKPVSGCVFTGESFNWQEWNKDIAQFSESAEANTIVKELVDAVGAAPNFVVRAGGVPNAAAVIQGTDRYIVYSPQFMQQIKDKTKSNWSIYSILAHELGHHFNGHTLLPGGSRPDLELQADEFSGHLMFTMGATLAQAEEAMKTLSPLEDGPTHPGRNKRLAAIEKGWNKAKGTSPARTGTTVPPDQAETARSGPWTNSLGMVFVPLPGADVAFCIWETRVQDFEAFVRETGHNARAGMKSLRDGRWNEHGDWWRDPGFVQASNHPVCGVSWNDANAFCQWLTGRERKAGLLRAEVAYRLPTDSEWSLAVGLPKEDGESPKAKDGLMRDLYPWGGQWPPPDGAGNYAGEEARTPDLPSNWQILEGYRDGFQRTAPVGSFKPSLNGIYDLGGNVWEWCEDLYARGSKEHVLRGGSWNTERPEDLLASARHPQDAESRDADCGFRCVLKLGPIRGRTPIK